MDWNFGDIADAIDAAIDPDALAYAHGERRISWGDSAARSNRLGRAFLASALTGDKVGFYMRNQPAYMEAATACFKARLAHVNVNYRYRPDEVAYIIENSDAAILVYDAAFRDTVAEIRPRLPLVKLYVEVGGGEARASFAADYEDLATTGDGSPLGIERSGDDLFFLYTGGTTGMPKGVMWPHKELRAAQLEAQRKTGTNCETMDELIAALRANGPSAPFLPACPLMHGTGYFLAIGAMTTGSAVVTLENPSFDPHELWAAVDRHKVGTIAIVGDAFAKPMLRALEERPGHYDLSSVIAIGSSGVMWSVETKRALLRHMPQAMLSDGFGSSEAVGFGNSVMTADGEVQTARFEIGERCKVFDENDEEIVPGSGKAGIIGIAPPIPLGYYKDPAKTASTFRTIGGVRYSMPGDWCRVEADGSMTLMGRGSTTINSAGEKIHPEEVEEALKAHPAVEDALVVGVPDEKFGSAVVAVVVPALGATIDEAALRTHVRDRLAPYKAPKRVLVAEGIVLRAPNGKADYKTAGEFARTMVAA